ncbi:MAG: fibronectin type III domain-containing protein, partial [Coriobacteriales bacterium]|nr:fibronectin type III domain-containing protein [Coriobacteriales bacterium]
TVSGAKIENASGADVSASYTITYAEGTITINGLAITTATITIPTPQAYTGKALTPAPTVKLGDAVLVAGTDYKVSYSDNTQPGTATVTVTGIGDYSGSATAHFTIKDERPTPTPAAPAFTLSGLNDVTYNGQPQKLVPTVFCSGTVKVDPADYVVSYSADTTDVGTVTVTVSGIPGTSYTGSSAQATYRIIPAPISDQGSGSGVFTIDSVPQQTYTGKPIIPILTADQGKLTLVPGKDYTATYQDNTALGEATVTVSALGNYSGTVALHFMIVKATTDLVSTPTKLAVDLPTQTYTGKSLRPTDFKISYAGQALKEGVDYRVSVSAYHNDKLLSHKLAYATVTITGLGAFSGSVSKTVAFSIALKTPQVKKVKRSKTSATLYLKSAVKGASRYIVYYSLKKSAGFKHKTLKLTSDKKLVLKKLKRGKRYYFKVKAYAPMAKQALSATMTKKVVKSKKLQLQWHKTPYVDGYYEIKYRQKGTHIWHYKKVKAKYSSCNLKGLKNGKYYQVKIYYRSAPFKSAYSKLLRH